MAASARSSGSSCDDGHFGSAAELAEAVARWRLYRARARVGAVTGALAAAHVAAICVLSGADARGVPELQTRKFLCVVLASLVAALSTATALAASSARLLWLTHGSGVLAAISLTALLAAPALQRTALQLPLGRASAAAALFAPALQAALLACLAPLAGPDAPLLAADGAALALTAALSARPDAVAIAAAGGALAAALRRALAAQAAARPCPSAGAVAAWQTEQERQAAESADFLASCERRRHAQVRTTMALAGSLCLAVSARGGLCAWHTGYNTLAACCMLATAVMPRALLAALFQAWPSLWAAVCIAMLPFHAASEQCARGYDASPAASCARLAGGTLDGASLLPFVVHVAVGPALRLPGASCYLFLLVPVLGFIIMELPHLRAFSAAERAELAAGLLVSAALSAHGVLCCDAAERDAHEQRQQLRQEKSNTREFTSYILHEVRVPLNIVRMGVDHLGASLAGAGARAAGAEEVLAAMSTAADSMSRIMNDVLDLSKAEEGLMQMCVQPFNAAAVLAGVASSWARPAAEARVRFGVTLEPGAAALLRARALCGDALRLSQVRLLRAALPAWDAVLHVC
jgi:hypothetical protein